MFVDECDIEVLAGDGGAGCVSFRREKYIPRGGPDGGDGGDGGSVLLRVNPHLRTLSHLRHVPRFQAGHGRPGMGRQMFGARGETVVVEVPPGTVVRDAQTGELVADAVDAEQEWVLARGGKGGRGNVHFKRPDRRTPRIAEEGRPGQTRRLHLTLRLLADVGLIGLPNAGKSTLLSRLSNAKPKIADYPFTTLAPILGIVPVGDYGSLVLADLPGLIEGASRGKGLGQRFLRHIERTRFLLVLIEAIDPEPAGTFTVLRQELERWSGALGRKAYRVCYSKADLVGEDASARLPRLGPQEPLLISSHTGQGLRQLLLELERAVADVEASEQADSPFASDATGEGETQAAPAGGRRGEPIRRDGASAPEGHDGGEAVRGPEVPWPNRWVIPRRPGARTEIPADGKEQA